MLWLKFNSKSSQSECLHVGVNHKTNKNKENESWRK